MVQQAAQAVLMVRPARFGFNPETAATNAFQQRPTAATDTPRPASAPAGAPEASAEDAADGAPANDVRTRAVREFDALVEVLRDAGVRVIVHSDTAEPEKPDAVFPNNWVSLHHDGTAVLYPLQAPNRRPEVRRDLIEGLPRRGFKVNRILDLTSHAASGRFLEGTGSLVFDHLHRVAYGCLSPRTDPELAEQVCRQLQYDPLFFHATDAKGVPLYHTNVMLAIGTKWVVVCLDAIGDQGQQEGVRGRLEATERDILPITRTQMARFAGNILEVGERHIVASAGARAALTADQAAVLETHGTFVMAPLETIETHGGGSARCMLAEIFLPSAYES